MAKETPLRMKLTWRGKVARAGLGLSNLLALVGLYGLANAVAEACIRTQDAWFE